ncbi:MAG TPA: type III-B CRISPR module-associated protein Cmr5, partial [Nannocystis sp.]
SSATKKLLDDLASFAVVGLERVPGARLPDSVRALPVDTYMLATREFLQVATWLRRAVQASSSDPSREEPAHAK